MRNTLIAMVVLSIGGPSLGAGPSWPEQMQALHRTVLELLPWTTHSRAFKDPALRKQIDSKVKELKTLTDRLKTLQAPGDQDPSTRILAELFADHAARAHAELARGNRPYARQLLNSVPAFCVACHTRGAMGPDFSQLGVPAPSPLPGMTDIENARLLVATRQYGAAMKQYDVILHSIPEEGNIGEWRSAVYGALALAVRVQADPERARAIVEHVLSRGFIPRSLRMDFQRWQAQADDWLKEAPRKDASPEAIAQKMRALYEKAKAIQVAPKDRGADFTYLRVSALGHEFLGRYANHPLAGEVLLLLGVSYEVMREWDLSRFHEIIYERCVRQFPGTEAARGCLQRYESSIADDYMGSRIPKTLRDRMKDLENMCASSTSK